MIDTQIINEITPLSAKDCFYIADRRKREFTYPMHCHKEYELNYVEHASGVRRIVGDSVEVIGDYDLVLITSPNLEHVWENHECRSENIREITIQFSPGFLGDLVNTNQFASVRKMFEKAQCGLCFPFRAIMQTYTMLDKLSHNQGFYSVIDFLTLLYELSQFADEAYALSSSAFARVELHTDSRRVKRVQEYINEHYQEEFRLGDLAEMVGMAEVSFSRFFKLRTGKSLSEFVIDIRIGHATRLLVDSTMSVAEICYDCGFNNLSNFNRIFKKRKGSSPKEFRDNYRKKKLII